MHPIHPHSQPVSRQDLSPKSKPYKVKQSPSHLAGHKTTQWLQLTLLIYLPSVILTVQNYMIFMIQNPFFQHPTVSAVFPVVSA